MYPVDSLLCHAARAVAWRCEDGWCSVAGPFPGVQAPRRAEVMAALFAVATEGPALRMIVTDCDYIATGLRSVARGHASAFVDGSDGDLWALFAEAVPAVRWIRSHQPAPTQSEAEAYTEIGKAARRLTTPREPRPQRARLRQRLSPPRRQPLRGHAEPTTPSRTLKYLPCGWLRPSATRGSVSSGARFCSGLPAPARLSGCRQGGPWSNMTCVLQLGRWALMVRRLAGRTGG